MADGLTFPVSDAWLARAARSDAWAGTRSLILENDPSNQCYPSYVDRANGAYLWDVDGNRYIDFILGYGPVVLGHAHPEVNDAVARQLTRGTCTSPMWSPLQVELTELLTEVIPGAEQAYLLRTGSDATSAAVRLARIKTGRVKVLKWGYNGWHDWTAPRPDGVPSTVLSDTLVFNFNDIGSVEEAFATHPGEIACVVLMTYGLEPPAPGFYEEVKAVAHRNGSLFVLDEIRSGFRIDLGGAQRVFGVTPDMSTFSKAMANGYAISAVVGRRDVMQGIGRSHMSSTYYANAPEMAAAIKTISLLRTTDTIPRLWNMGERLQAGLDALVKTHGFPARVVGLPISPFLEFQHDDVDVEYVKEAFYRETTRRGVLFHPNHQWFVSGAHTMNDIELAIKVCDEAMERTAK